MAKVNGNEPLTEGDTVSYYGGNVRLTVVRLGFSENAGTAAVSREGGYKRRWPWFVAPLATLRRYDDELHGGEVR
jgi:hypothetical protein